MVKFWQAGDDVEHLRTHLKDGGVVAIPTESSYGLAVDPRCKKGVEAVYAIKQREERKPLSLVVANLEQAEALGLETHSAAFQFGRQHWPAPLTMLVPFSDHGIREGTLALGPLEVVAVRIPAASDLLELLKQIGHGLTATSANLAGQAPLLSAESVAELLDAAGLARKSIVVKAAPLPGGPPSTVVAWQGGKPRVVRPGRFVLA